MIKTIVEPRLRRDFLPQILALDLENYSLDHPQNWIKIAEQMPQLYTVISRGHNVFGYSLVMPLRKAAYKSLRQGEIGDFELQPRDISDDSEGFYVASVAASRNVRNKFPLISGILVGLVGAQTIRTSKEVIAIPVSRTGKNLAEMFGMHELMPYKHLPGVNGFKPAIYIRDN